MPAALDLPPIVPCRSCRAPMMWALTDKGKRIPLDAEPDGAGNIVIVEAIDGELHVRHVNKWTAQDGDENRLRYTCHFATCPDAGQWRKPDRPRDSRQRHDRRRR